MTNNIPSELYRQILDKMPIPCMDVAVRHKWKLLLVKRKNPPLKGVWFMPGGRIFKGENFVQAAERKLKEETNLNGKIIGFFGPYETMFDEANLGVTTGTHTINVVALVEVADISGIKIDGYHEGYKFVDKIEENWHPYLKQALKDCKFFK